MIITEQEKRRRLLLRIAGARDGKVYIGPTSVYLPITNQCSLRCRWCWHHSPESLKHHQRVKHLPLKQIRGIVRDCVDLKVDSLEVSGEGEPTLHPDFSEMMTFLSAHPIQGVLYTNGTFSEARYFDVTKADKIVINLGAAKRDDYLRLQSVDLFDRVIENIRKLVRFRDSNKPSLKIGVSFVVNRVNISKMGATESLLKRLRVDFFNPVPMQIYEGNRNLLPDKFVLDQGKPSLRCFFGWFSALRSLDGRMLLCYQLSQETGFRAKGSFKETWLSSEYMKVRLNGRCGRFAKKFKECNKCIVHGLNDKMERELQKK